MLRVNVPIKMPTTWASGAKPGFIRTIGNPSQIGKIDGAASYTDGFPPLTFTPVSAGGVPPYGADMNGVLNQMTQWDQWAQAGGPIRYDAIFQSAIGGYPAEARVGSNTTTFLVWQSTADNNTTNPDTGTAVNWQTPVFPDVSNATKMNPGLTVTGASTVGANLAFVGNGAVTPRKWLRVWNGNLSVMNNANLNEIFTLTDAGDLSNLRNLTAAGNTSTLNLSVSGTTTTGAITASGDITSSGRIQGASLAITGNASVGGFTTLAGVSFGATVAPGGPLDLSKHIALYAASYGFSVTNGTMNLVSAGAVGMSLTATNVLIPTSLTVNGLISGGSFSTAGNATVGNTTVNGTLTVTNTASLRSNATVGGTLGVTGAATVGGALTVTGNVTAQNGLYVGTVFSPNFYGTNEWSFQVDPNLAGTKYQIFRAGGWYNAWNGQTGTRTWASPTGGVMTLDGSGNFNVMGGISGTSITGHGNLQIDSNANVNGQIVAGTGLYAGTFFSPNAFNNREWSFGVDASGNKFETFRSGWSNSWNATTGARYWSGPGVPTMMSLDGLSNLYVGGQIIATTGLYAGNYFSPHAYNTREWSFTVDVNNSGHKIQTFRAGGWNNVWNGVNGTRSWNCPGGNYMTLDGVGNLATSGTIASNGNITAGQGRLRATYGHSNDSNAAPILGDFGFAGSFGAFIIQWPRFLMCGVSVACSIGDIAGSGQVGVSKTYNFNWPTTFVNQCVSAWGVGNDIAPFQEGSEMCIGMIGFNQTGGAFRINRVSGVNIGNETFNVQVIGIGW
jgi:cytoskeletal protein CcmA (bactofilin family)